MITTTSAAISPRSRADRLIGVMHKPVEVTALDVRDEGRRPRHPCYRESDRHRKEESLVVECLLANFSSAPRLTA